MSKHTSGPWCKSTKVEGGIGKGNDQLAICFGAHDEIVWMKDSDHTLSVAAPDLLASLEECLPCLGWENDDLEELQREHELGNGYAELIIRARAAIARAKGEA